jgi:hypothetical protein
MKRLIYIFCCLFFTIYVKAQSSSWQLSGRVVEKNQAPVPFANVYLNNTRIGTSTDVNGKFYLKIPANIQKFDLIVSFIGYKNYRKSMSKTEIKTDLTIVLENGVELNEVKVVAQHDKEWRKKWKLFYRGLFGDSEFTKDCKILNPEVIHLDYVDKKKLIATASEPILIQNDALGLKIALQMEKFETDGEQTFMAGFKFFSNLDSISTQQSKRWTRNRERSYNDSFRNFLVSLAQRKFKENGFAIFKMLRPKVMYYGRTSIASEIASGAISECTPEEICSYDPESKQYILQSDFPLMVFATNRYVPVRIFADYPNPYSIIDLIRNYAVFSENGWLTKPNGILLKGYWGAEGMSSLLPDDYMPLNRNNDSIATPIVMPIMALKGFKVNSIQSNVMIQGLNQNRSEALQFIEERPLAQIVSNDINVKISESDYNLTIFDLLRRIPGLMVINEQGQYRIHFRSTNTNLGGGGGSITPALLLDGNFINDESTVMDILNSLIVRDIKSLGAIKYGNSAAFGARGANGTIVIVTNK